MSNGAIKSLIVLKRGLKKDQRVEIKKNVRLVFLNSGSGEKRVRQGRRQGLQGAVQTGLGRADTSSRHSS